MEIQRMTTIYLMQIGDEFQVEDTRDNVDVL
jgi:hypothetical protein